MEPPPSGTDAGVKRRGLLRLGTLVTAITGISAISALGANSANAAPGDKNPPTTSYIPTAEKGTASGVATLGTDLKIPRTQIPDLSGTFAFDNSFDVRKFGARFDGLTDDTAAIQNAINACATAGGGDVVLPYGDSVVNGGLTWPLNKMVRLLGQGVSASGNIFATRLKRTAGTTPIINASGIGQAANQRVQMELHNLALHGGDKAGSVVKISRSSLSYLNNIRVSNNNGGCGLEIREMWDSRMHCVYVQLCGGSGTIPAVLFADAEGETVVAVSDGIHITTLAIHSSYGPDLRITGNQTLGAASSNLQFVNLNIEGKGTGTQAAPDTYVNIDLEYAQDCTFTNTRVYLPTGRASTSVISQASAGSGTRANHFTNTVLGTSGLNPPATFIQQTAGSLMFNNLTINGAATNTLINIAGSVGPGRFKLRNFINNQTNMNSGFISDGRSVNERIGRAIVPVRVLSSTNSTVSLGQFVVYPLNDAAINSITAQIPIPADADANGKCTIRVTWATAGLGNVVFRWVGRTVAVGDDPTAIPTNRDLIAAASPTAGRTSVTEWNANEFGFPSTPGGTLCVQLMRLGDDAADTVSATVNIIAVEMIYNQRF